MKLSDAIRLGAMMKPQAFSGAYWPEKSCALQAACDAVGINSSHGDAHVAFADTWGWSYRGPFQCPECQIEHCTVAALIAFCLNDDHEWSRERIADYIATLEPQDAPVEAPAMEEVAQ